MILATMFLLAAAQDGRASLLRRWFGRAVEDNPADQLTYARELEESSAARAARRQYRALVKNWPLSREAIPAQYNIARLRDNRGRKSKAFEAYAALLKNYGEQVSRGPVLERMLELALEVRDRRRGSFLFFPGFRSPEEAAPLLQSILDEAPQWKRSDEVRYRLAETYRLSGRQEEALRFYRETQLQHPYSDFAELAGWEQLQLLKEQVRKQPRNQGLRDNAYAAAEFFIDSYPASEYIEAAREIRGELYRLRARAAYDVAEYYDRLSGNPRAALTAYRSFVNDFPRSPLADDARKRIAKLSAEISDETQD